MHGHAGMTEAGMVVELGLFELTVSLESNELWCGV